MKNPLSRWKSLIFAGSLFAAGYTPINALAVDVNIDFATNGPTGNLNSAELLDLVTGLKAHGLYLDGSWKPANLYRRNQTNDLGLGVCNPVEAITYGGDCPGPEWGGDVNELDDAGQRELIVLELPQGYEWVSVGISSMDTNDGAPIPERGQLYADADGIPNSNFANNAGDSVISQFEGGITPITFDIVISESNARSPFLILEPSDWSGTTGNNNDYLVAQATVREVTYAQLGDRVWEDRNYDGIQNCADTNQNGIIGDAGDMGAECNAGIPDVMVNLGMPDDLGSCVPVGISTTTNAFGFYGFDNLTPDNYCVVFDKSTISHDFCSVDGVYLGEPQFTIQHGDGSAIDSDANPANGETYSVALAAGEVNLSVDAGLFCPAKLGDRVWLDQDGNGLQDSMEPGVSGVTVNLLDCGTQMDGIPPHDAPIIRTTVTDETDGLYMFGGQNSQPLAPGNYAVNFVKPNGFEFTMPYAGDAYIDSDVNQGTGSTTCMTLSSKEFNPTKDAGLVPKACSIKVDKTCLVPPLSTSSFDKCKGKLQQFTVSWHGDGPIIVNGLGKTDLAVNVGDEVTFTGPFAQNDVEIQIAGSVTGKSKFHMSCSDEDFNDPSDCGKYAGNGKDSKKDKDKHRNKHDDDRKKDHDEHDDHYEYKKDHDEHDDDHYEYKKDHDDDDHYDRKKEYDNHDGYHNDDSEHSGYINKWKLEGFVDAEGQVLDCTMNSDENGTDSCMIKLPKAPSCKTLGKPHSLTFKYVGNGSVSDCNNNAASYADKKSPRCRGNLSSGEIVSVSINRGSVSKTAVEPGEEFTISGFKSRTKVKLEGMSGSEVNKFRTSCSAPLEVGDVFGNLQLVAFDGQRSPVDVTYNYKVTNIGDVDVMNIIVNDDMLDGQVTGSPVINVLSSGESVTLTEIIPVYGTVTNLATVTAETAAFGMCSATDSVTVTAVNDGGACNTCCKGYHKHKCDHKDKHEHKHKCDHKDKHDHNKKCDYKDKHDHNKKCDYKNKHDHKNDYEHKSCETD